MILKANQIVTVRNPSVGFDLYIVDPNKKDGGGFFVVVGVVFVCLVGSF